MVYVMLEPDGPAEAKEKPQFDGSVILDKDLSLAKEYGAGYGSIFIIDKKNIVRWHKPGTKFKRPRTELLLHALEAITRTDKDPKLYEKARSDFHNSDAAVRARGAASLGALESASDREALEQAAVNDKIPAVRTAAAEALGWIRDKKSIPVLCKAVQTGDAEGRGAAGAALANWGNDYMDYPGPFYRLEYTHAVHAALVENLKDVLAAAGSLIIDKKAANRAIAARIFWRLKEKAPKALLLKAMNDSDEEARYCAFGALAAGFRTDADVQQAAGARKWDTPRMIQLAAYVLEGPKGKIRE
ncbi:MAG: HEAT repeat domain-containing protein [Planctomycetes bacterium]|nr:HEAT repeat domain-containing protein [Planctomycetota bacterium]